MFLKQKNDDALIKVLSVEELTDPFHNEVLGCIQDGQEEQDPEPFTKSELIFPSGESLPRCWCDSHYREHSTSAVAASQQGA